jgi:hypothetical protein
MTTLMTPNSEQDLNAAENVPQPDLSRRIIGNQVTVRQGGAQSIEADHLIIRQGGVGTAKSTRMELNQGGVGFVRTDAASISTSKVVGLYAGGDIHMDQSLSQAMVTKGSVTLDQSAVGIMIANQIHTQHSTTIFLLARKVEGELTTLFGMKETFLFGAIAGIVFGLVTWVSQWVNKSKGKNNGHN